MTTLWVDAEGINQIHRRCQEKEANAVLATLAGLVIKELWDNWLPKNFNPQNPKAAKERQGQPQLMVGILVDGKNASDKGRRCGGIDIPRDAETAVRFIRYMRMKPTCLWGVKDGHCQHAVYQYHELYAALCQCQRDDLFLIAKHDCTYRHVSECQIDYREGATTGSCITTIDNRCLCFTLTQCP